MPAPAGINEQRRRIARDRTVDPLDQTPDGERPEEALQPRGSEDAQLLAEAETAESDVETESVRTAD